MRPCTPAPDLGMAHLSLRFDAQPEHVAGYVAEVIDTEDVDVVTCTESKGRARAVRKRLGKSWRVQSRGEYLVCSRRAVLGRWHGWPARLRKAAGAGWHNRGGGDRAYAVLVSNLRHLCTGSRVRVMVAHTPSHVQVGARFRRLPARVNAWTKGLATWGRWIRHCARHHKRVVQVAAMDSNVENHLPHWRHLLEHELGLPSIWRHHRPKGGTHGHRLIDTAHTNARVTGQRLCRVRQPHDIDHGGIVFRLHLED